MKHKTIKKSIIFIMITTLLLSCASAFAYTVRVNDFEINGSDTVQLTPDNVINSQPDQTTGSYYITYRFSDSLDFYIYNTSKNKYWNGLYNWRLTVTLPNAYTVKSIEFDIEPVVSDFYSCFGTQRIGSANKASFMCAFTNLYPNTNYIAGCNYTCYITIQALQTQTVPAPTITANITCSDVAGTVSVTDYPEIGKGLAGVIGAAVMQAINASDFNQDIEALLIFAASQEGLLEDVIEELQEANINLGDIVYYLNNTQNARLNTIISKIQELIDMGRQDTQAQNELGAAAQQMENAAAAMNVTKPNIAAVIPETLLAADAAQAQSDIFSWLQNGYILQILIACFTIALIGFVLYGKSG